MHNPKPLASLCSWAVRFESYLVANPEDRFSHDEAHIEPGHDKTSLSPEMCYQVRLKPVYSASQVPERGCFEYTPTLAIILSNQRTAKMLIRLRGYAGWSVPLLFASDIRNISVVCQKPSNLFKLVLRNYSSDKSSIRCILCKKNTKRCSVY